MLVFWEGAANQYQNPSYSHPRNKGLVRLIKGQANGCFKLYIYILKPYVICIYIYIIYTCINLFLFCGGLSEGSSDGVFCAVWWLMLEMFMTAKNLNKHSPVSIARRKMEHLKMYFLLKIHGFF